MLRKAGWFNILLMAILNLIQSTSLVHRLWLKIANGENGFSLISDNISQ